MKRVSIFLVFMVSTSVYAQNLRALQSKAREEGKNVLLSFTAVWCGPCKWMDNTVFKDSLVKEVLGNKYILEKIDIDSNAIIASFFDVKAVPEYLILDSTLAVLDRRVGAMSKGQFLSLLQQEQKLPLKSEVKKDAALLDSIFDAPIEKYQNPAVQAKFSWIDKRYFSRWKAGLALGTATSWVEGSGESAPFRSRFRGGIFIFYQASPKFFVQPGIFYSRKGGNIWSKQQATSYLEFPLVFSQQLFQFPSLMRCREGLYLDVAPYTGVRLGNSSIFSRTDYGIRLGLSTTLGSFMLSGGYSHGLQNINQSTGSGLYNRSVFLQASAILGR